MREELTVSRLPTYVETGLLDAQQQHLGEIGVELGDRAWQLRLLLSSG